MTEYWDGAKYVPVDFDIGVEPEQFQSHPGLGMLNQENQKNEESEDISKTKISEKRSPVDVPDATSENDMYCDTNWNIVTENKLDMTHIKQSTQSTIAQFGETYFLEERVIDVFENSAGYTVSISGLWDRDSVQYSMISQDLEKFGTIQGEPASCQ